MPCQIAHLPSTAVDMMRLLNCFGVSLCILYWTWFGQFDSVFSPGVMFGHALAAAISVITFVFRLKTASGSFFFSHVLYILGTILNFTP